MGLKQRLKAVINGEKHAALYRRFHPLIYSVVNKTSLAEAKDFFNPQLKTLKTFSELAM